MARILSPDKRYNGISASVHFCNGVGETEDGHLIKWFKEHGYEVEEDQKEFVAEKTKAKKKVAEKSKE